MIINNNNEMLFIKDELHLLCVKSPLDGRSILFCHRLILGLQGRSA